MKIYLNSRRGQFMAVLLTALEDFSDRIPTKREVEQHIEKRGYLKLTPDLLDFYGSKQEPRWKTELAYARADAIRRDYLKLMVQRDAWEISTNGRERLSKLKLDIQSRKLELKEFKFWSSVFLKRMGIDG